MFILRWHQRLDHRFCLKRGSVRTVLSGQIEELTRMALSNRFGGEKEVAGGESGADVGGGHCWWEDEKKREGETRMEKKLRALVANYVF